MSIKPKKYSDNYNENESQITEFPVNHSITDQSDRIIAMNKVLKNYKQDFNMIKIAETNYERLRTLNNTKLIQVDVKKSIGNILGSLSVSTIWDNPSDRVINSALAEARASLFARAVGPLEELPVSDYIQDKIRAKNVISNTQIGSEQRLIAKLVQMRGTPTVRGNKWQPNTNEYTDGKISDPKTKNVVRTKLEGIIGSKSEKYINGKELKNNLYATEYGISDPTFIGSTFIESTIFDKKNRWHPNDISNGVEYSQAEAEVISDEHFNFKIENLAGAPGNNIRSFPAHITNLNESVSSTWSSISLINRSQDLYIYQRAERSFNLEFFIFASSQNVKNEFLDESFNSSLTISTGDGNKEVGVMSKAMMWDRINFLHQLTKPEYSTNGTFNKSPFCRLYIAGLFQGTKAIIESVNINYDPMIWDLNIQQNGKSTNNSSNQILPMVAQITLAGKLLNNITPSSYSQFYGKQN